MSERKWTDAQKSAIELQGGTLLVSAAAGSGKTAVLVERIIKKITGETASCDADKLLVVTFTNAAAAEMKERVSRRLDEMHALNPDDINITRQQMLLQNAHISTIHSFCLEIIREHFEELDISPDVRIADDNEIEILRGDILEKLIEEKYAEDMKNAESSVEKPFLMLSETLGSGRDDGRLIETVLRLYNFSRSLPDAYGWLCEKLKMYDGFEKIGETLWGRYAFKYIEGALKDAGKNMEEALEAINRSGPMSAAYGAQYGNDLSFIKRALKFSENSQWDELYEAVNGYKFEKLGALRKFDDTALKDKVKRVRDGVKSLLINLKNGILSCSSGQIRQDLAKMRPMVKCLFDIVIELSKRLDDEKKSRSILDFSDLEQLALKLLVEKKDGVFLPTETAKNISAQFDEILIDEYQDTNFAQDTIFKAVSRNGENIFMVGDVKQSIYRFRQAMPQIFLSKKDSFAPCDGINYPAKIILGSNFRSRAGVTGAVNFIFRQLMSRELGEIEYNAEEELIPAAEYPEHEHGESDFELHLIDKENYGGVEDSDTLEARHIAKIIRQMVEGGSIITSNGKSRPAKWGDFCILLRSTSIRAEKYMREIAMCGVPVWAEISNGYINSYEVAVMLSMLRILDNPLQDVPLLSVMLSPIFGFSPDDVAKIRIFQKKGFLYTALVNYARKNGGKYTAFLKTLEDLRRVAVLLPADRLILKIYDETGFLNICEAMPEGDKKRANLRLLLDYARNYEAAGYRGLSGFIRFIDRLSEKKGDLAPASVVSETADVVKIMSIHKSKGLEFPVCIVAGCSKQFNLVDGQQNAMFSPSFGFGCMLRDEKLDFRYTTLPREIVKNEILRSTLSEEMRVLYVAMTRAKEKLIMVGTAAKLKNTVTKAAELIRGQALEPFRAAQCQSFLEWILPCALRHPCCSELRRIAGIGDSDIISDPYSWKVVITGPEEKYQDVQAGTEEAAPENDGTDYTALIEQRLSWKYPYSALSGIPSKISVTEIAEKHDRVTAVSRRPAFLYKEKLTGAEAGTALHSFMQYADFSKFADEASVNSEIERLVRESYIVPAEGEAVNVGKILQFAKSGLFSDIRAAEKIWREFRFDIEMPVSELYYEHPELNSEMVVVQGMADVVFIKDGRLCILDYKTDFAHDGGELIKKYKRQIDIYEKAVASVMGCPVAEKHIYSFHLGRDIIL